MRRRGRRNSFGTIIATGTATNPAFVIRWWEGSRRKQKSGFTRRTDAADALARIRTGLGDGTLVERRRAAIGFDQVAKQWLDLHSAPNLRSHLDNEGRYRIHVAPFFGDAPLTAITPARILEFRAKLQSQVFMSERPGPDGKMVVVERRMAARTINLILALVRSILRFAVANGHITASPTDRLGRGKLMVPVRLAKLAPPVERPEDVGRLLKAVSDVGAETARPWLHPFFALLAYSGLRFGEAIALRWADVDLDRRIMTVRRSWGGPTKAGKQRLVPIAEALMPILTAHRLADPWQGELVFTSPAGGLHTHGSVTSWKKALWTACDRAKLRRIRIHDLRHVFASYFVMSGGDIFTLQRILGHSSPMLTSETYAHLGRGYLAGSADRVTYPTPADDAKVLPFPSPESAPDSEAIQSA